MGQLLSSSSSASACSFLPSDMNRAEIKSNIEALIKDNPIVVFSKTYCPYALKAKSTLDKIVKGKYLVVELNGHPQMEQIQSILGEMTGGSTVPRVFIHGKCIGGGDDTARLYDSGELQSMINQS